MELDELHVRDVRPGPPCHPDTVAGGDTRIGGIEINLAATTGGEDDAIGLDCVDVTSGLVEHVSSQAAVLGGIAELAGCDEVHRHVVFQHGDIGLALDLREKGALDLAAGDIPGVEHPALGVAPFPTEIEFPLAVLHLALVEMDAEFHQLLDAGRSLGDDRPDHLLVAEARPGLEGVLYVQLEGILAAGDAGNAALSPCGV